MCLHHTGAELTDEVSWIFWVTPFGRVWRDVEWLHVLVNNNEFSRWLASGGAEWSGQRHWKSGARARAVSGVRRVFLILDGNSRGNGYLKARGAAVSS